ncbi:MAG: type II secretion system protein [Verrucomicrobia bacterium]|nr:type II secretion system protein [Verrucomicrobiota bacterium]MCH8525621.1 type II secretion system GspH family protein [Kiritimatiellia bacterium]
MKTHSNSKSSGFTLIEMLVVIAIIILLASLITGGVNRAVGRARTTQVANNLRQIGLGMQMYLMDHNQMYPVMFGQSIAYGKDLNGRARHWQEQMNSYVGGPEEGENNSIFNHSRNPIWYSPHAERMGTQHFGLNRFMAFPEWEYRHLRIPEPAKIVIVGEMNANASDFRPDVEPVFNGNTATRYRISNPGDVALYLFADGRVEPRKGNQGMSVNPSWYRWW